MWDLPFYAGLFVVGIGASAGYFLIRRFFAQRQIAQLDEKIKAQVEEAKTRARAVILEAQERATALLEVSQKETRETKVQLVRFEERLLNKETALEKLSADISAADKKLAEKEGALASEREEVDVSRQKAIAELERISRISKEEAVALLLQNMKEQYRDDLIHTAQKLEREKQGELEKKSLDIITLAIQRYSRSHVSEVTTSTITLKNEDVKGKIIGKEGRNIRALERLTGVELVMDETPDTVVISSFDPVRREIARLALEKLIQDGRIQPAKIEEKVEEAKQELNKRITEAGEQAVYDVGVYDLPKEIVHLLGRLNYRYGFGQHVLTHSVEVAHLASMIASELGLDVEVAKRGGLLHDIGKAIDHDVQGSHVEIGRKILQKYGVDERVVRSMEAHHDEYPYSLPEAYVVTAADAISASRPGARKDTLEHYLKRLGDLEKTAMSFQGVRAAYAISAGREVRVFVTPEKVDDFGAMQLARDVAMKIESDLRYPGEIKVVVIREVRAVEHAR